MTVTALKTLDMTRRWSEVRFDGVKLDGTALMGSAHNAWPNLKRTLDWATAALCAEMVGGTQKVLETSTEHANDAPSVRQADRHLPGGVAPSSGHACPVLERRPIATYYPAWAVTPTLPTALWRRRWPSLRSDAYRKVAATGSRWHGGIGFTWEHDMHLLLQTGEISEVTLADATYHRELVAQSLEPLMPWTAAGCSHRHRSRRHPRASSL